MRGTKKRVTTLVLAGIVLASIGAAWACSDSAAPLGSGNKVINDTTGMDAYQTSPPPPPATDGATAYDSAYHPALDTCGSCSCDPTKNYCMSGGVRRDARISYPYSGGGFGEPDSAPSGPPPAPCKVLDAGAVTNGCIPLPPACEKNPTCNCLVVALQPLYGCYLDCSPTPGFLEVYCPQGP
jgi:hypothetical protein